MASRRRVSCPREPDPGDTMPRTWREVGGRLVSAWDTSVQTATRPWFFRCQETSLVARRDACCETCGFNEAMENGRRPNSVVRDKGRLVR
jgi:hypothetical protein